MKWVLMGVVLVWAIMGETDGKPPAETCKDEEGCARSLKVWMCNDGENEPYYCHNCTTGYTPNDAGTGCIKCENHCWRCTLKPSDKTKTDCTHCESGYYPDTTTRTCVDSKISHCLVANVSSSKQPICQTCLPGYYLVGQKNCKLCDATCKSCTASACTGCYTGTPQPQISGTDAKKCAGCTSNCVTCTTGDATDPTKCTKCADGFYLDTTDSTCKSCSDSRCKTCSATDCSVCKTTNYKISASACAPCGWKCDACSGTTNCSNCMSGYAHKATTDIACDACPANCDVCTVSMAPEGKCTSCSTGYARDTTTEKCVSCSGISKCTSCTSTAGTLTCSVCETGYKLFNNVCYQCPSNCPFAGCNFNSTRYSVAFCDACDSGFTTDASDQCVSCGTCEQCVYNDTTSALECVCADATVTPNVAVDTWVPNQQYRGGCSDGDVACKVGHYYVDTGSCSPCSIRGCQHCNESRECIECDVNKGYALVPANDGSCHSCSDANQCISCATVKVTATAEYFRCDTCKSGHYANNETCTPCPSNCATCTSSTTCSTCKPNFTKFGNLCVDCSSPCATCSVALDSSSTPISSCSSCVAGYVFDSSSTLSGTDKCRKCPDNCNVCELDGSTVVCSSGRCNSWFGRATADKLCHACPRNCTSCSDIGSGVMQCSICQSKFVKNEEVCSPCPASCKACSMNRATMECTECDPEHYINDVKRCSKCLTDCSKCSRATECSKCKPGKGLAVSKTGCPTCAALTKVTNCNNCTDDGATIDQYNSTCLGCSPGFVLADNASVCLGVASFGGQCNRPWDKPPTCKACKITVSLTTWTFGFTCHARCFSCGGDVSNPSGSAADCDVKFAGFGTPVFCPRGCAWSAIKTTTGTRYAKGCANLTHVPVSGHDFSCSAQGDNNYCVCVNDNCNWDVNPASASGITVSVLLMVAALFFIRA